MGREGVFEVIQQENDLFDLRVIEFLPIVAYKSQYGNTTTM